MRVNEICLVAIDGDMRAFERNIAAFDAFGFLAGKDNARLEFALNLIVKPGFLVLRQNSHTTLPRAQWFDLLTTLSLWFDLAHHPEHLARGRNGRGVPYFLLKFSSILP